MRSRFWVLLVVVALAAVSCGSDAGNTGGVEVGSDATPDTAAEVESATETAAPEVDDFSFETVEQLNQYIAEAATFDPGVKDAFYPTDISPSAGGAPGYSRYVFRENSSGVVPTLVEGPLGNQTRCLDPALPCSYTELIALQESGDPIPEELGLTREELDELAGQLRELSAYLEAHRDPSTACANGYFSDQIQTPNMGSHFYKPSLIADGFVAGQPEILLYALADDTQPDGPLGQCRDGKWDGPALKLTGAAYIIPPGLTDNQHPEAFAGDLDNWHIHYNLCRGNNSGRDTFVTKEECQAQGGNFSGQIGWMMHAWADPLQDSQIGVFGMWNDSVAPISDAKAVFDGRTVRPSNLPAGAEPSLITDFEFGSSIEVDAGQSVYFSNVDSVPHTVSAGTDIKPALDVFDSGLLVPGDAYTLTLDDPGTYAFFCTLHPDMTATVTVR